MFAYSAIVLVDSSKWVTENTSYSIIAWFSHGVSIGSQPQDTPFISYKAAVTIATLLAMSLVLSSASLLLCHLSNQWLREFVNQPQFSYRNQLAFRQIHYDSLCRWGFFNICDIIPFLLFLGARFSSAGLIVFLWQLDSPGAYIFLGISCVIFVYRIVIAVHPLYCFLKAPKDSLTAELSPFRSPSSWFFFKLFMRRFNFMYCKQRKRAFLKKQRSHLPLHSQLTPPATTKSIDWLEQDCSLFMQTDNAPDINTPLTDALIWIDSNPTIEKTTKVVVSVYHCISDLHLPSILPNFKERWTGSESGLARTIATAAQKCTDVNDPAVTAFVMKSWLELHVTRLPELRTYLAELQIHCMNEFGKRMPDYARVKINPINAFLIPGHRLPVKIVHPLLATTRTVLADGIYYEGTFKLIFQVIFQFRDSASERQVDLVLAVLTECKQFAYSFRASGVDEQQAREFMSEIVEFLSNFRAIDCYFDPTSGQRSWSPLTSDIWKDIITIANDVYSIASVGFRDTFLGSPTKLVDDGA